MVGPQDQTNARFHPKKAKMICLLEPNQKELSTFLKENLAKGYIRESNSPQTSPVFFIRKKDGSKRMVINYQYLNKYTVKNNFPIPLIEELVDKLKGCNWSTNLDLQSGYTNIWIKK